MSLLVRTAGQETGDFGHIYADREERSLNRRGYNLVALSPDGRVLDSANFDTHADPAANTRLAQWVAALPVGTRVAGAGARRGVAEPDARGRGRAAFAGRRRRFARAFPLGSRVYRAEG